MPPIFVQLSGQENLLRKTKETGKLMQTKGGRMEDAGRENPPV